MSFLRTYILPPIIALIYWLWSHTWRFKILESPEFKEAITNGRVIFAHWHGDEMVVLRLGPKYTCAAMTSTSKDGELMTRVLKIFGFGISRGSSTRGGARALIGMISMLKEGYNATVAVDGPKGPLHKVKPGVWALAKHSECSIVPTGVARESAFVFEKSWNKTYLPWPFSKVLVSFGKPLNPSADKSEEELCSALEKSLVEEAQFAQSKLLSLFVVLFLSVGLISCSSTPSENRPPNSMEDFLQSPVHVPLKPVGRMLNGNEAAVITYMLPGGLAQKYGFKTGDRLLKINGKDVDSFLEFEKKIKNIPSQVEITYKRGRNEEFTKNVALSEEPSRFGASTEPQNLVYIKRTSPVIAILNKGPTTLFGSCSTDTDKKNLFMNFIVNSKINTPHQVALIKIYNKKTKKLLGDSSERVDALGTKTTLVARKFPLNFSLSDGFYAVFSLGKQQFTFEFQE